MVEREDIGEGGWRVGGWGGMDGARERERVRERERA